MTLGKENRAPIVLAPVNDVLWLLVAEGVEDALAGHEATGLGTWAAGTAGRLAGLADLVPGYVEAVTIVEDNDTAGHNGTAKLAERLIERGFEVSIARAWEGARHG